uniref:RING-type domain-containing protein n=1 Tax=Kalanchoe fedtschenkoi TaxID=63787 RepID=A0A7N0U881_KALFE
VDIASSAPAASTPGGLDQPASSSSTAPESSIANTPTVSGRSAANGTRRGRISLLSVSRLWFWLRQLIAAIQIVACSVSLALVQDSRDGNSPGSYRMLIVAYLVFRVVGLFPLCWDCCRHLLPNPFQIPDEEFSFASGGKKLGATEATINGFSTYTFKLNRGASATDREGGVLARGTDMERVISAEDAVCAICLGKYEDNDELRELACLHLYHKGCVDQWLKVHAACPYCRHQVNGS